MFNQNSNINNNQKYIEDCLQNYIESTDDQESEIIYSNFYLTFLHQPSNFQYKTVSQIYNFLSGIQNHKDANYFINSLKLAYKFILDYEFLIDLSCVGPQRHKNRRGLIYLNDNKFKSLIKIHCNVKTRDGNQNFPFYVQKSTYISNIALAIGVFYKTELENVYIFYQNCPIGHFYTIGELNVQQDETIFCELQRTDSYDYSSAFLSILINNDDDLFHNFITIIKEENFLSFCTPDQSKQITKFVWKLLKVIPTYKPLYVDMLKDKYEIEYFNREKTELMRRYILQIMKIILANNTNKIEIVDIAFELISKKLTDNELRDTFEIITVYYQKINKIAFNEELILMICDKIIKPNNPNVCQSALNLLVEMKRNSEVEKFILTLKDILLEIMRKEKIDVEPFFNSFRMHRELFDILKVLVSEFSTNETMLNRLFKVLKNLININCETEDALKFVLENLKNVKPDFLIEYLEFVWHCLEVKPQLLYETAQKNSKIDPFSIVDYLFNFISSVHAENDEIIKFKKYERQLRTVSLNIFIILCKNNDSIKKAILKKMEIMSEVRCVRWHYAPESFKKNSNGYCGLRNLGSTCYMNSVFQQLYFDNNFRTDIFLHKEEDNKFVNEIRRLFINLALSNQASVDTNLFTAVWGEDDPLFSVRNQEDAREFFQKVLSKLPSDVNKTFAGKQTFKIEGINVEFHREIEQDFNLIEIQVKGYNSFEQSLPTIFNPQTFTGDQYHDDKYGNIDVKYTTEYKLPKTVVFLLKRFDFNKDISKRVKITNEFSFPLSFSADKYFANQTGEYNLKGVITHTGNADGGHYNSIIKHGDIWINFDDIESRNITDSEFFESVKGNQYLENAKCAYLLFYECNDGNVNDQNKITNIKNLLSKEEIDQITKENNDFSIMQASFDSSAADFALNSNDLLFTIHYFINVLCHSCMTKLSNLFSEKILKYINDKTNAQMITSYLNESRELIFEIAKGAASEFKDSLLSILSKLFEKVDYKLPIPIVDFIVSNLKESISVWRTLPYLAKIIYSYIKIDQNHAKIGSQKLWGDRIISYIQSFYDDSSLGQYALENIDFSKLFESLEIFYPSMNSNQIKSFVTNYEFRIEHSGANLSSFRSLKEMIYGVKEARKAAETPEDFCNHIVELKNSDYIIQSIEKCGKPKTWILDALISCSSIVAPTLLKFQSELLLPMLTDNDFHNREKAEKLMYKIFNELPPLENYQKAERLYFGRSYINVFDRQMAKESNRSHIDREIQLMKQKEQKKQKKAKNASKFLKEIKKKYKMKDSYVYYLNHEADEFVNSALEYIGLYHTYLANRMSHLFRIIHWLKVRLHNTNILNLREVLNFIGIQETCFNIDLLELFHLYQTFTEEQFDSFFKEYNLILMYSFCPGFENLSDRVARFVMFISLLSTPEQFIMCLKSDNYFFPAYSYLIECPLPQPLCYMASKLCYLISQCFQSKNEKSDDKNKEDEELDDSIDHKQLSNPVAITENYIEEDETDEDVNQSSEIEEEEVESEEEDDKENKIEMLLNDYHRNNSIDITNNEIDNEINQDGKDLILSFIEFIGNHADYSFFTPQTKDGEPCFIRILRKVMPYFTPELTSLYINQYFSVYDYLSTHSNFIAFTNLICDLPNTDHYSVSQEMANQIITNNFEKVFIAKNRINKILINMVSSSHEFANSFSAEFESYFTNKKITVKDKKTWSLAEVYLNCAISGSDCKKIYFFISNYFGSDKSCIEFAKSENGRRSIKLFTSILQKNDSNIDQDEIFDTSIELFGFLTSNKIPINQEIEEFINTYLDNLNIYDLDVEYLADIINNSTPDFEYAVTLLNVFFKAKEGMKEYFLKNYPINQNVLTNWPSKLEKYRNLFII